MPSSSGMVMVFQARKSRVVLTFRIQDDPGFLARKTITMPEEEGIRLPGDLHALIAC